MIRLRARYALRRDDGVAMLFVIAIGLVITAFVVAMFSTVLQASTTGRVHRNVTSAQGAAEAALSDVVLKLGQNDPTSGQSNWGVLPTKCPTQTSTDPACVSSSGLLGGGASYRFWITNEVTSGAQTGRLIIWAKGTYGANTRTVRETVMQSYPPAFDYSMFASKGIDIHHHGSSWLSPQVGTTSIHSNGYIKLDYSSDYTLDTMEAVGNITFASGGGSTPGGNIPTGGYNWYDPLPPGGLCYPGGVAPTSGVTGTSCNNMPTYSGNATVTGSVEAGSVTMASTRGQIKAVPAGGITLDTGKLVTGGPYNGGIMTSSFRASNGQTYTTTSSTPVVVNCGVCNAGGSGSGGTVQGQLMEQAGYAPLVSPFPYVNYANFHSGAHLYATGSAFFSDITATNTGHNYYKCVVSGQLQACPAGKYPDAIEPPAGTYDVTGTSISFSYSNIQSLTEAATGLTGGAPIIIIRGTLIAEQAGITLNSGLVVVGQGNEDDFLVPGTSTTPVSINTDRLLDKYNPTPTTQPGLLLAGGSITATDYDTDSSWTASCHCYEPAKATPVYIRGLVYSASYDATTGTSVPANQHWHNYDPKNLMKIYGSQVGADLHDCNNFTFTYDPIVRNAFGFGGGNVKVVDYQELGA